MGAGLAGGAAHPAGLADGACRFTDVAVNEHPLVDGRIGNADGYLEHHDSPIWTIG